MAQTVFDEGDEAVVNPRDVDVAVGCQHLLLQHLAVFGVRLHQAVDGGDSQLHNLQVSLFVVSAHVVDFALAPLAYDEVDGLAVVFHIEPVADVAAVAIDGQLLAFQDVFDDERYQLLGEVIGAVVVAAAGDADGHVVGVVVGHDEEVGTGLRGAVRAVGAEGCLLGEVAFVAQGAVDFVGADLVVAHAGTPGGIARLVLAGDPGAARGVEQVLRAQDIGDEEELGVLNAAVDVALGSEVDDVVELVAGKEVVHQGAVADVSADKDAAVVVDVGSDGAEVACIGQRVEHDDADVFVYAQQVLDVVGADESGGAGYEVSLHISK